MDRDSERLAKQLAEVHAQAKEREQLLQGARIQREDWKTSPPALGVRELAARMDPRLHHQEIMVTSDGIVLVRMMGHWHTLADDFSVKIDLAPLDAIGAVR